MDLFVALAEPTRRDIISLLASQGSQPSSAIAKKFHTSPSAISQHLKILRQARLVLVQKKAQQRIYSLEPASIAQIETWLNELQKNWNNRLGRLDDSLTKNSSAVAAGAPAKTSEEVNHGKR
ncbi:MAG: ArsR/SmtB family transcription factor [Candidatus Saccharimonadales bacterium]